MRSIQPRSCVNLEIISFIWVSNACETILKLSWNYPQYIGPNWKWTIFLQKMYNYYYLVNPLQSKMLCKHWFSLILGSWEVNLFCSFILFWGVDEVWQREGPAQGQNGVIDQPCQEGVLLIFQLHRGKRGGKRWRVAIQPVWNKKVVSGDWPVQDLERKDRKAEFYADGEGKEIQKREVLQRVDTVRSAGK